MIRVKEFDNDSVAMIHGMTVHGIQFLNDRTRSTTYFVKDSGVGLLLDNYPRADKGLHVGVLGLGAGTLATYAQRGDTYRFYEINPVVCFYRCCLSVEQYTNFFRIRQDLFSKCHCFRYPYFPAFTDHRIFNWRIQACRRRTRQQ